MAAASPEEITRLLKAWGEGDHEAFEKLMPLVYEELRQLAHLHMSRERSGHTLQTTALVNEAYLRLADQRDTRWENRAQFFGISAQVIRRILLDHARKTSAAKRGGHLQKVELHDDAAWTEERAGELLMLDSALDNLAKFDPRKSRIVELRYFGGLSVEETAEVMKVSAVTVMRDWSLAKAWLHREMVRQEA